MVLTHPKTQSHEAARVTETALSETSRQPDLPMVDGALQVTECLMPSPKAEASKQFFCRRPAVVEELCHQVKELQEEANRLSSV